MLPSTTDSEIVATVRDPVTQRVRCFPDNALVDGIYTPTAAYQLYGAGAWRLCSALRVLGGNLVMTPSGLFIPTAARYTGGAPVISNLLGGTLQTFTLPVPFP